MYTYLLAQTGGGGGGNWIQIIAIIAMVGLSALSWLFQKISEQAQKKKQLDTAQKRELERLRTGRDPGMSADDPQTARQRELAARRQAQLEELRRRQQERVSRQGQPQQGQPPVVFIPGSSGPIIVNPRQQTPPSRPGPRPQSIPQRVPPQRPFPPQRQQQQRPAPRPQAPRPTQQRSQQQRPPQRPPQQQGSPQQRPTQRLLTDSDQQAETGSESHRLLADRPDVATVRAAEQKARYKARTAADVPKTPSDWRRAIIARELLAPPLSLRQPGDDPLI